MISKKNSALIFDPKLFVKNTKTDQNLTFPFKKHEIFGGVAHVSHMARKLSFIWQHADIFFHTLRRSKGIWATNLEARAPQLKCLGSPSGSLKFFPRAQPCSPVLIRSMIHYMLLLNVEVHFLRTLVKECKF